MWISKNLQVSILSLKAVPTHIKYGFVDSKFGRILIGVVDQTGSSHKQHSNVAICLIYFVLHSDADALKEARQRWTNVHLLPDDALIQEYSERLFQSGKKDASNVVLAVWGTSFQLAVWTALLNINAGSTCTYGDLAQLIDRPKAVRAVANAVAKNEISVLIPCHRIVSQNGKVKYHWGAQLKSHLLEYESHTH